MDAVPVRIAIVTHNVVAGDGQGRVNLEFARFLLSHGHEVEIFADQIDPTLRDEGARWTAVHPGFQGIDLLKVWRFKRMADAALASRAEEFDAIVACGVSIGRQHDLNVAHFVHGTWLRSPFHASRVIGGVKGRYQWAFSSFNARWERQVFAKARRVGAVSTMVADELRDIGVPPERIVILGNGVDVDEFKPGMEDRSDLALPDECVLGLFVGDIQSPIKNLDGVLRAMTKVRNMHLAVAGRATTSPYPELAKNLGLSDRVHFLDFRTDIASLMRAADFFVLVSRRDSCPLVVLEALASGLPVVTARTVGNYDLVEEGAGFVIDTPDSAMQLEAALSRLTNEPEMRAAMSRVARSTAMEHTWTRMSERYLDLLQGIATDAAPVT